MRDEEEYSPVIQHRGTELIQVSSRDLEWAGAVLGRAFMHDPMLVYIVPEESKRIHIVPWYMTRLLAYSCRYGYAYATSSKDGVIFFLPPGESELTYPRMFRVGMLAAPIKLGVNPCIRLIRVAAATDKLHAQYAPPSHYYLFGLGVDPSSQGKGAGSYLLELLLQRCDAEHAPCYLETHSERNIAFYKRNGFDVVVEAEILNGGLRVWGMRREPRGYINPA